MNAKTETIEHEIQKTEPGQLAEIKSEHTSLMQTIQQVCSDPNFDPAKMQQIIDMRREMFMEQARIEFNSAMARVQADIEAVVADADNTQTNSRYAKLVSIVAALKPVYTREGFSVSFGTSEPQSARLIELGWFRTTADLDHIGGFTKHYHVDLPADTVGPQGKVNKTQIHGAKSAISYARVILMGLMFNFTTSVDVDDDGNAAGAEPPQTITEKQAVKMREYLESTGSSEAKFLAWVSAEAGRKIESVDDIPARQHSACVKALKKQEAASKS